MVNFQIFEKEGKFCNTQKKKKKKKKKKKTKKKHKETCRLNSTANQLNSFYIENSHH